MFKKFLVSTAMVCVMGLGAAQLTMAANTSASSCELDCFMQYEENCSLPWYKCRQLMELCLDDCN